MSYLEKMDRYLDSLKIGKSALVDSWFMMSSPTPIVSVVVLYLLIIRIGPRLMKNRPPLRITKLISYYNASQVVLATMICIKAYMENNLRNMVTIPANEILFGELCNVLEQIHKKKKQRPEQDKILSKFVNTFSMRVANTVGEKNSTFFPILRLLLPDCERERSAYNLKETKLGTLLVKVLSLNKQSVDAQKLLNFRSVHSTTHETDFASVAYFVLKTRAQQSTPELSVGAVNEILDKIAKDEIGNKGPILDEAFSYAITKLTSQEFKWFLRMILKDLKLRLPAPTDGLV